MMFGAGWTKGVRAARTALAGAALGAALGAAFAADTASFETLAETTERRQGLFDLFIDDGAGRLYAVFEADEAGHHGRYIHTSRLTAGLGSNPVGLDRGFGNSGVIIRVERVGARAQFIAENHTYRAVGADAAEALATTRSFAQSVIWAGPIADRRADGAILVDLTDFLLTDRIDIAGRLKSRGQGSFKPDAGRSAVLLDEALAFPENIEVDARLTFTASEPGDEVDAVTPDARAATLVVHHSFVAPPVRPAPDLALRSLMD